MEKTSILAELKAKIAVAEADLHRAEEQVKKSREQWERLQTAHQVLEEMLGGEEHQVTKTLPPAAPKPAPRFGRGAGLPIPPPPKFPPREPTVEERAIEELKKVGAFLSTQDLVQRMQASGYKSESKGKVYDTVYGTLDHARKKENTRLVRQDAKWGLREWLETPPES